MAYTALYRKFRPLTFQEMVGQSHITETLKKQIIAGRVGHAYLFNGGRGTGKTSAAKILARAVNCLNPKDGEPCNECEICKSIIAGSLTDVVEMDAASNNSVEDIRSIREEVNFLPTRAKYRVYIIDEVHMLSTGAFNALLKTLEEPPEHVKFILATTEPQKLPATILSRCQRFDFKRISNDDIIKRLKIICKESNIEVTEDALKIIAILSEGAMRDAISILERCLGQTSGVINEDYVRDLVGIPKTTQIYKIVKGIVEYNQDDVIEVTSAVVNEGKDIDNFLWEIIKYIKNILVFKSSKQIEIYNKEEIKQIEDLANCITKQRLLSIIYDLSKLANDIKWSSQKTIMFEAGMIAACMNNEEETIEKVEVKEAKSKKENIENIEKKEEPSVTEKIEKPNKVENANNIIKPNVDIKKVENNDKVNASSSYWNKVLDKIKQSGKMGVYVNLIGSTAKQVNDLVVEINLANKNVFAKQVLEDHENKKEIEKYVSEEVGKPMNIKFVSDDKKESEKNTSDSIESLANDLDIPFNVIDE